MFFAFSQLHNKDLHVHFSCCWFLGVITIFLSGPILSVASKFFFSSKLYMNHLQTFHTDCSSHYTIKYYKSQWYVYHLNFLCCNLYFLFFLFISLDNIQWKWSDISSLMTILLSHSIYLLHHVSTYYLLMYNSYMSL